MSEAIAELYNMNCIDHEIMVNLGMQIYYYGIGNYEIHYKEAVKWCERGVEIGYPLSYERLAYCYIYGDYVKRDDEKVMEYYKKAYQMGRGNAARQIAYMYIKEYGVKRNNNTVYEWLRKAIEMGDTDAIIDLANCYYEGIGQEKNINEAKKCLKIALEKDIDEATVFLGKIAVEEKDYITAVTY